MANETIKQAYVKFNGQTYAATYSTSTGLWSVDITAPSNSSWSQPNHVYLAEIYAEDQAGNTGKLDSTDKTYGDQLKIRVLEKTAPTATITYPTNGSVIGQNSVVITARIKDTGGSGLDMSTVDFKVNNKAVTANWVDGTDGEKTCSYSATGLSDGNNTISLKVSDNDGNPSTTASVSFVVSTAAPSLDITAPIEGLITNKSPVTVTGTAKPGSTYTTVSSVTVNGKTVTVGSNGAFSYDFALTEGSNTIEIVATDDVGHTTTVRRTVTLDTKAPIITDVVVNPTTVDASGIIHITFKVTDNQ